MWTPLPKGSSDSPERVGIRRPDVISAVVPQILRDNVRRSANPLDISENFTPVHDGRFAAAGLAGHAYPRRQAAGARSFYPKGF